MGSRGKALASLTPLRHRMTNSTGQNPSDPGDPCNSYDWSIVFCLVMVLSILSWLVTGAMTLSARNARGGQLTGLHKLSVLLALCSLLQFGPMLSSSLHSGHNVFSYTQTGCKLLFYTEYGTRHVITALLLGLFTYCHYGLHHGFESIDGKLNTAGWGWLLLMVAAVQGLFGMVPAMYVDLSQDRLSCSWTYSMSLNLAQVVSMELVLRPLTPYLVPGLILIYPIISMFKLLPEVTEQGRAATVRTVLYLVTSYFILNSPYAINLLVEYGLRLTQVPHSYVAVCNLKWFFFLIHQSWFLMAPLILLFGDPSVDLTSVKQWTGKIRKLYDDKVGLI